MQARLAIKVDVDTDRGTREGLEPLLRICDKFGAPASFLFSLGPDNTGKAIRRVFRPGFLKKVRRTNVAGNYGLRTLLNGTLLPAPMIARRNADAMRAVKSAGHVCGIHCWDHFWWQDYLAKARPEKVQEQFTRAVATFDSVFGEAPACAGAPGWQCTPASFEVYDAANLLWGSDTRWQTPWAEDPAARPPVAFLPKVAGHTFQTLHFSTTLPTLDELMGRPEFPDDAINAHYINLLKTGGTHVHTIHAEIEGLNYAAHFEDLLARAKAEGVTFFDLSAEAESLLTSADAGAAAPLPVCEVVQREIDGRSGTLGVQLPCAG